MTRYGHAGDTNQKTNSMRTLDSTLSLIRRGSYELRVMKLCSQGTVEELWLELIDHHRERTIDSYRGRDLEDIAIAARSLVPKMLRGARRSLLGGRGY
jgi:hypothetical protein